jgi:hypothetical protein
MHPGKVKGDAETDATYLLAALPGSTTKMRPAGVMSKKLRPARSNYLRCCRKASKSLTST